MAKLLHIVRLLVALPILSVPAFAQFDPHGTVAKWPAGAPKPLPTFDARLGADGNPAGDLHEINAELRTREAVSARTAEERALRARIPLLRIDSDPVFGTPRWIASTVRFLTPAVPGDAFDAVAVTRAFVAAHPGLFEVVPEELDLARRSRDYLTQHNGVHHLSFQQQIGGVDLLGAELRANVTRHGELVNVSSTMLPRPAGDFATSSIALTPLAAIRGAAASIGTQITADPKPVGSARGASRLRAWAGSPDFRSGTALTTELVYFPITRSDVRAGWKVVLPEIGVGNTYEIVVDATDGRILSRRNETQFLVGGTQDLTLRVYTKDSPAPGSPGTPTPNGTQFPFDTRQLLVITPASVPQSPQSWINDNDNDTQGNNVDAHLDLNDDDNPDLPRPTGVPFRTFDFAQNNAQDPTAWRDAAVTNLFYFCNMYHDRLFSLGFDEAAGNFQTVNFSGQGAGTDRVLADAQDGGGTNNANFGTGPDGVNGRMQMYVFDQPVPQRDGDLDSDIVYHEHSHGLSYRLHNLALNGTQPEGMGEGWGDFLGICLNADATDDPNAVYCTGGYTVYQLAPGFVDNYYFGIRRFPYSTDLAKNPETYGDTDPGQQSYPPGVPRSPIIGNTADEVHNVGEVWCNMLIEARASLWAAHGFAGNDLVMQLVVDGMKLDPGNPNFLDARDAILQADLVNNGGANTAGLWGIFAKRGCGYSATSPGTSTSGVFEAFDLPLDFDYPVGVPERLDPGVARMFQVNVGAVGIFQPIPNTGVLHVSVNGGAFASINMTETTPNHYDATLPAGSCFDEYRFYVSVNTNQGIVSNPAGGTASAFAATVRTGTLTLYADNFETDQGWTNTVNGATTGAWERGVPVNDPGWPYGPITDGDGSGQCYLTMNQPGNTDVDGGSVTLISPIIDMTGGADIRYDYYLDLTISDGIDQLLVEIDSNGGAGPWIPIAVHATSGGQAWHSNVVTTAALTSLGVAFTSTMQVRFTANDGGTPSIVEAGVDGFRLERPVCAPVLGTSFCWGDGVAAPCPCGNTGAPGQGCQNSVGTHGARLVASGTVAPDTAILTTTGELAASVTMIVQGTASITPRAYGDGLRCVGGSLKRLYVKTANGGEVTVPEPGDLAISARSAALGDVIPSGATRSYFAYYHDTDPTFCASPAGGSFNASNAVSIVW